MINSKTKHPNCAYLFINHIVSPLANAKIADYFGEAPANAKSCELTPAEFTPTVSVTTTMADHCALFHAAEDDLLVGRLLLDDPRRDVPRWPDRREVRRLRQVDRGMDPDQGLIARHRPRQGGPGPRSVDPGPSLRTPATT